VTLMHGMVEWSAKYACKKLHLSVYLEENMINDNLASDTSFPHHEPQKKERNYPFYRVLKLPSSSMGFFAHFLTSKLSFLHWIEEQTAIRRTTRLSYTCLHPNWGVFSAQVTPVFVLVTLINCFLFFHYDLKFVASWICRHIVHSESFSKPRLARIFWSMRSQFILTEIIIARSVVGLVLRDLSLSSCPPNELV